MSSLSIVKIGVEDVEQLQKIAKQTFYEAFASQNDDEDMQSYLLDNFTIEKLQKEIEQENTDFYFAYLDHQLVGYLKFNFGDAQTEIIDENTLEIERIYVLQEYLGKNVGQSLLAKAIEAAIQAQSTYIWLGVWEKNYRAIRFYQKNEFVAFGQHIFHLGTDDQTDILMKLILPNP